MRKVAFISAEKETDIKKVMLYETSSDGTYLFGYDTVYDTGCIFDNWFEDLSDA